MKRFIPLLLALLAGAAHAAGTVQINFVQPERFADVRDGSMSRDQNLAVLKQHLEAAAAPYVADGQTMKIDVLDVDLAGEPSQRFRLHDVRVMRGRTDWPRLSLRWALDAPGQTARGGEAMLSDMAYLQRLSGARYDGALHYERRMIDEWFAKEFRKN
jgi:hypothetical protein